MHKTNLLSLPQDLLLRVFEELSGADLARVESVAAVLRSTLHDHGAFLYQNAVANEFSKKPSSSSQAKAAYVKAFVQERLDNLARQQRIYQALKLRVEELDDLLLRADDVRLQLGDLMEFPSLVMTVVGDMEQDVLQQRWDATEEMLAAEAQVEEMQQEVDHLLSRMPRCWRHQLQEQQPQQQQNGSAASCSTA